MLSKSKIKLIGQLKHKKYRQFNNMFIVEGSRNTLDFLKSDFILVDLIATAEWIDANASALVSFDPQSASKNEIKRISALTNPSDVIAIFELPNQSNAIDLIPDSLCLALDDIHDPGNLGTIIRTADWFGIDTIFCSMDTVDAYNPKVVQATMGSLARVNVIYTNLEHLLTQKPKDFPVFGALLDGTPLNEVAPAKKGVILIGSEAHGISSTLIPLIDKRITIPMGSQESGSRPESLNASIACAVICYALKISN